jgi:hypothetical protein
MMRDMLLSQQYFCAGTLLTLVFSMLLGNRRSPRGGALFCASMALLSAVVLQILKTYYEGAEFDIQIPAISAMCAGLTVLCAAALLTAFFLEYRKNGLFLWKEFLLVCTPPWVYGLVSVLSQNAFQFTEALTLSLLLAIAVATLALCFVQFELGRLVGRRLGEEINAGQALFQKNTALSIWVAYMYLSPVASIGAGCYVLWQNIINSMELWQYRKKTIANIPQQNYSKLNTKTR